MSRTLALLLLIGVACLAASAAGAGGKVTHPAAKAPAPTKAAAATASSGQKAADAKKVLAKTADLASEDPLAGANCTAQLCIGTSPEEEDCKDFNYFDHEFVEREHAAHIPKILDNTRGNNLRMMGDPSHIQWGVVFHDLNQLMAVTLKLTASGKISLHYMLNSYMPKVSLAKATVTLTCDKFKDVAGVRADYNKHNFPTDIETKFTQEEGKLVIHVADMASHHCANLKASWYVAECEEGECCHAKYGKYFDIHKLCRRSYNPCIKDTYCNGHSEDCPTDEYERPNTHCAWSGHGEDYYDVEAAGFKHTRMPAGSAVSIASANAASPSFGDIEECGGKCGGIDVGGVDNRGKCMLDVEEATCCKEVLKYGSQYGYGAIPSYGYDDEDTYKSDEYKKSDEYSKGGGRKNKYDYDVYTAADKSGKAAVQQAKPSGKAGTQADVEHIPMISCWEGEKYY